MVRTNFLCFSFYNNPWVKVKCLICVMSNLSKVDCCIMMSKVFVKIASRDHDRPLSPQIWKFDSAEGLTDVYGKARAKLGHP